LTKTVFTRSLVAGILAALAANIYNQVYFFATQVDFSSVVNVVSLVSVNLFVSLFAGILFMICLKLFKSRGIIVFNLMYSMGSFACVMIPIMYTLPLSQPFPELFPGLAVPMVFFPVIAWMTIEPFFSRN
jgi:hypothetical protein